MIALISAGLIGGLLMAVAGSAFVALAVSGSEWDGIIAGAMTTLVLWITGMLLGFTAPGAWAAWRRVGIPALLFAIGAALLFP